MTSSSFEKALLEAQRAIRPVSKDATNAYHRYDYVSAEAMYSACRDALHVAGLAAKRPEWTVNVAERKLQMFFELSHAESGELRRYPVEWPIVEDKGRPFDKAVSAALTTSFSYWLRDLLLVPRKDEHEVDKRDDTGHDPKKVAAKPKTPAPIEEKPKPAANVQGYDPSNDRHNEALRKELDRRKIDVDDQDKVAVRLKGRSFDQIDAVIRELGL